MRQRLVLVASLVSCSLVFSANVCAAADSAHPTAPDAKTQHADALLHQIEADIVQLRQELGRSFIHGYGSRAYSDVDKMTFMDPAPVLVAGADALQGFFESAPLSVDMLHPYSLVTLDIDQQALGRLLGYAPGYFQHQPQMAPSVTPVRITFKDGSSVEAKDYLIDRSRLQARYKDLQAAEGGLDDNQFRVAERLLLEGSGSQHTFFVDNPKPIRRIRWDIRLPLPEQQVSELQPGDTLDTDEGNPRLEDISNNTVILVAPEPLLYRVGLLAQYEDGRHLQPGHRSDTAWLSDAQQTAYQQRLAALQQARERIEDGAITSRQALDDYVARQAPRTAAPTPERQRWIEQKFAGQVDSVQAVVSGTSAQTQASYSVTLAAGDDHADDQGPRIATDFISGKLGLLGNDGHWTVAPRFAAAVRRGDRALHAVNRYYYKKRHDGVDTLYRFDADHGRLDKPDYRLAEDELMLDRYAKIKAQPAASAGKQPVGSRWGVVDARTGRKIVPTRYPWAGMEDDGDYFFGIDADLNTHVYHPDGRAAFVMQGAVVSYDKTFFYAITAEEKPAVYTLDGDDIIDGRFDGMVGPFSHGRLYVTTSGNDEDPPERYFMDPSGAIAIDIGAKGWADVEPYFNDDLIYVQDAGSQRYGFADVDGELTLPFHYHDVAHGFMPASHLAVVQPDADATHYDFIDKHGETRVSVVGPIDRVDCQDGGVACTFHMEDGRVLDAFGEEMPDAPTKETDK